MYSQFNLIIKIIVNWKFSQMTMELNYNNLKTKHRESREHFSTALSIRTHRALSWLERSEKDDEDLDAQFIFLWISFNSAYANEIHDTKSFSERRTQLNFIHRLIESDSNNLIYQLIWKEFTKSIRLFINNQFVYQPFWEFQKGNLPEDEWRQRFENDKATANRAMSKMDTKKVLAIILDRLYVLRNQLLHGGATWNGKINRDQVRDGTNIMRNLVPIIINIMLETEKQIWGDAAYPVID